MRLWQPHHPAVPRFALVEEAFSARIRAAVRFGARGDVRVAPWIELSNLTRVRCLVNMTRILVYWGTAR